MTKKVEVHGYDVDVKVSGNGDKGKPEISIRNSDIDFNAQPEKVADLLKALGIAEDVTVEMRVTTASTVVE